MCTRRERGGRSKGRLGMRRQQEESKPASRGPYSDPFLPYRFGRNREDEVVDGRDDGTGLDSHTLSLTLWLTPLAAQVAPTSPLSPAPRSTFANSPAAHVRPSACRSSPVRRLPALAARRDQHRRHLDLVRLARRRPFGAQGVVSGRGGRCHVDRFVSCSLSSLLPILPLADVPFTRQPHSPLSCSPSQSAQTRDPRSPSHNAQTLFNLRPPALVDPAGGTTDVRHALDPLDHHLLLFCFCSSLPVPYSASVGSRSSLLRRAGRLVAR